MAAALHGGGAAALVKNARAILRGSLPAAYALKFQADNRSNNEARGGWENVTRADLCEALYQKVGLSRTESASWSKLCSPRSGLLERGER